MKIICNRDKLLAGFQIAAAVAPSRSPKEILQNVKMIVDADAVTLMATDMEVGIRVALEDVTVDTPGSAVLPVDRFGSILRECTAEEIKIEAENTGTQVTAGRSRFKLPAMNPDEFPDVEKFGETRYHKISAAVLKELIRRTLFAVDSESGRFALAGVLVEMEDQSIIAVGSDGRRLAKMEGPGESVEGHQTGDAKVIVPSRSMQLLERALSEPDEEIQLACRSNDLMVRSPRFEIYTRLLEGRFPRWRDAIPKRDQSVKIPIQVGPLHSAVRQASIVADSDSRGIDFEFEGGTLVITGASDSAGQSRIEMPCQYDGAQIKAALDFRYVGDFLRVLDLEKSITIDVVDADSPALFMTDDGYNYVVMPLAKVR